MNKESFSYSNLAELIRIYCFQEEKKELIKNKKITGIEYCYLIKKGIINEIKNHLKYNELENIIKTNPNSLECIKGKDNLIDYKKLNNETLTLIVSLIPDKLSKEVEQKKLSDINFNQKMELEGKIENKYPNEHYYDDFEIISYETFCFFAKELITLKIYLAYYQIRDGKIFITSDNPYFNELGFFDKDNNFCVEYLIWEHNHSLNIRDLIYLFGINYFYSNQYECFYYQNFMIYCLKLKHKYIINTPKNLSSAPQDNNHRYTEEKKINTQNFNNDDNNYLQNLTQVLLSLFANSTKLYNKISSTNQYNNNNSDIYKKYYLVNKHFIIEFKSIFYYNAIFEKDLRNNQINYSEIKSKYEKTIHDYYPYFIQERPKMNDIKLKYRYHEYEKINKLIYDNLYVDIPNNFEIIDEETHSFFSKLLSFNQQSTEQINICINNRQLMIKENKSILLFNKNHYFLHCYLIEGNNKNNIIYKLFKTLYFINDDKRYKYLDLFLKNGNFEQLSYPNNVEYQTCIINSDLFNQLNSSSNKITSSINDNISKYIENIIDLNNEYFQIKAVLNSQIKLTLKKEKKYCFIFPKYIELIEEIFHFQEINNLFHIYNDNNIDKIALIKLIIKNLDQKISHFQIDKKTKDNIQNYNSQSAKKCHEEPNNFNGFRLINENIANILCTLANDFSFDSPPIYKLENYFLGNKKFLYSTNLLDLYIGNINEKNIYVTEYIFEFHNYNYFYSLFNNLALGGFEYLNYFNSDVKREYYGYFATHYTIGKLGDSKANLNINLLKNNKKLEALIRISLYNQKNKVEEGKIYPVVMLKKEWLDKYQYDKIKSTLSNSNLISQSNSINDILTNSSPSMDKLFNLLDSNILTNFSKTINSIQDNSFEANSESVLLKDKTIKIYHNFCVLYEEPFNLLQRNFPNIQKPLDKVKFLSNKSFLIISIKTTQYNIILAGKYNNNNYFDIQYILDFISDNYMENELTYLQTIGINDYINNKCVYNRDNQYDVLSPILNDNVCIGYAYKFNSKYLDYSAFKSYFEYSSNFYIKNLIYFCIREKSCRPQINSGVYTKLNCYLIHPTIIQTIKANSDYNFIKSLLDKNNNKQIKSDKDILYILKSCQNTNELDKLLNKQYLIGKAPDVNIILTKYNNSQEQKPENVMIYDNFSLIDTEALKFIMDNTYLYAQSYSVDCYFRGNDIIINYPGIINSNKKFVSVIGKVGSDNIFQTQYLLIFDNEVKRNNNVPNCIQSLNFSDESFKFSQPIIEGDNCVIIGTFIKYQNVQNQIYEPENPIKEPKDNIKSDIIFPVDNTRDPNKNIKINYKDNQPLIGLENIGATCYMNSTLQCFCHIAIFVNFFKYDKIALSKPNNSLTYSFKILIDNLWPNNYNQNNCITSYAPNNFKEKISLMDSLYQGKKANDAKDLIYFIIMTLHDELNEPKKNINQNFNNVKMDPWNAMLLDFDKNENCIISTLFYAIKSNSSTCKNCGDKVFNYQKYFFLTFPLEEVRKFIYPKNIINLYDCFNYESRNVLMTNDNKMYCNHCLTMSDWFSNSYLSSGPNILIITLNRGKGIQFNVKIEFEEKLFLKNYIFCNQNDTYNYDLIGVVTHLGESGMGGHFIAFCKGPVYEKWFKYNDSMVTPVNNFKNEIVNFGMPYVLFYKKIN